MKILKSNNPKKVQIPTAVKAQFTPGPKPKTIGTMHPAKSLFLREAVGTATLGEIEYEMTTLMNRSPMIKSKKTGKWFVLSWQAIIELAVMAGIDEPDESKVTPR